LGSDQAHACAPQTDPQPLLLNYPGESRVYQVTVTFFTNSAATSKHEEQLSLEALAQLIDTTTAPSKEELPWLKLARFGSKRSQGGSLRNNGNVIAISGLEADYDRAEMGLAEAQDIIVRAGITAILYHSPSYTSAQPKWRVLCPFSREYPPEARSRFMARLNGLFGGIFSRESWVLSQSYYYGRVNNLDHHAIVFHGEPIDLADWLDQGAIGQQKERNAGRPARPASAPHITEARVRGLVNRLLDNIRNAEDGEKHFTLRDTCLALGGYLHLTDWSSEEAAEQAIGALRSADDWDQARQTALWAITVGMQRPLDLEDRPDSRFVRPGGGGPQPGHAPEPEPNEQPAERTIIEIIRGEYPAIAEKIEVVATTAQLPIYSHGDTLCRPVTELRKRFDGEKVTVAVLRNYNAASLRRAIAPAIGFERFNARSMALVACEPPADIINMVLAGTQKQIFPPVRGIIATPILRPDHTIVTTPGYDSDTGYYLVAPPDMPPIAAAPTRADAIKALAVLADLLSEFPFVDDVSRSVAYSGLITPLVRAACDVVPGHLFTAPKQGSGKSLLVDVASAIATGERAYAILAHQKPEEQDKQLTGALLEGRQIIALDNLAGEIDSAVLAQVTERERVSVRPLGTSQTFAVLNSFNVYLTGNNVTIAGDNIRRLLVARIDPRIENPLDRTFEKQNPVTRVFADRGPLVAAILTIVLAYVAQGRPHRLQPTPSYQTWSELVREPLVWLGLSDPTDSMRSAFDEDPNNAVLATLMTAWPGGQTDWTSAELIEAAMKMDKRGNSVHPGLADALRPIGRDRRGMLDAVILGNYLRLNRDKIVGSRKISRRTALAGGSVARWFLA
jgi:putative DNA primase/helicase